MSVSLHMHGAAGIVTGSCFRLITPHGQMLVDCGMFQGPKSLRALNYRPFPFDAALISSVIFTHAHIDHTGLFPKLALAGFRGRAWTTPATRDLLHWLLPDSGTIQENDVDRLNRRNSRRAEPRVAPIYTSADAEASLALIHAHDYGSWFEPLKGVRARLRNAGHILGSAFVELEIDAEPRPRRLVFSGDLGSHDRSLEPDADLPWPADIAVIESTYGDTVRTHLSRGQRQVLLQHELGEALKAGGNVIIPVFAVERTQEILADIAHLKQRGDLRPAVVFLDSPLAGRTTEVFRQYLEKSNHSKGGPSFSTGDFRMLETVEQSKSLGRIHGGAIVLAGSGMCEGGRVKHHLKDHLWRPDSTVLFVGYQAPGTLGALIRDGAPRVRIHGEEVRVRARIRSLDAYSGHADREELVEWARPMFASLGTALVVHGEPASIEGLVAGLDKAGLSRTRILVPMLDQQFDLEFWDGTWRAKGLAMTKPPRLSIEQTTARRDWHNDYAQMLLDLRDALRVASDDETRRRLLSEVRRVLHRDGRD